MDEKRRAIIAMSGGVDSSVAAYLMRERGFDCMGVTMKLFRNEDVEEKPREKTCCSLEDVEDAVFGEDDEDEEDVYEYEEPEEDEDCYATTCPTCEETIYFDESVLEDGEVICPNCGEKLEFDLNGLEDEDKPQDEE